MREEVTFWLHTIGAGIVIFGFVDWFYLMYLPALVVFQLVLAIYMGTEWPLRHYTFKVFYWGYWIAFCGWLFPLLAGAEFDRDRFMATFFINIILGVAMHYCALDTPNRRNEDLIDIDFTKP